MGRKCSTSRQNNRDGQKCSIRSVAFSPNDTIGTDDRTIVYDVFTDVDAEDFTTLKNDIGGRKENMFHVSSEISRLVCVQAQVEE